MVKKTVFALSIAGNVVGLVAIAFIAGACIDHNFHTKDRAEASLTA